MSYPNKPENDGWTMTDEEIKAALVDIEISALELSTGNFEAETFKSDCVHIATEARQLHDHVTNITREKTK